ncbi:unnamed protein product [Ectocarpus sp. 12 AP-2014]
MSSVSQPGLYLGSYSHECFPATCCDAIGLVYWLLLEVIALPSTPLVIPAQVYAPTKVTSCHIPLVNTIRCHQSCDVPCTGWCAGSSEFPVEPSQHGQAGGDPQHRDSRPHDEGARGWHRNTVVWVDDYHLMLLSKPLHGRKEDASQHGQTSTIVVLHRPFPVGQIFRCDCSLGSSYKATADGELA